MQKLAADYDALMTQVRDLAFGPLPEDMSRALSELAAQYPDVLSFDPKKGMLRFASDFTFALGSADLTSSAQASLTKLAGILNTPTGQGFEVRVIGHTDNVPISQPQTRAKHPTNWHLSAHRAISVASSLMSSGVSANRFQVAGYGEYRPVVPNPTKGGAAQNRRVEIFLLPMPEYVGTTTTTATVTTPSLPEEPMK
jgi:chemotaxis protein MotB